MSDERPPAMCTTSGEPVDVVRANQTAETGQHPSYIVLCPDERAKGFVRPYRDAYTHVGLKPTHPLRDLTDEERARWGNEFAQFEPFPPGASSAIGRFWTQKELDTKGCGTVTTMGRALSETYARQPSFYGMTFCVCCNRHLPVAEFVWTADGQPVGS